MNLPNKITVVRLALIPVMMVFFFIDCIPYNKVIAAAVFIVAAFTDFLDGYLARKHNLVTNLGKFLDPIADKVLVVTALLLILEGGLLPRIYGSVGVIIIVAREFMVSALRLIAASSGVVIAADKLGKIKTISQDIAIPFLLLAGTFTTFTEGFWHVFGQVIIYGGYVFFAVSVLLTVISGVSYIVKNIKLIKTKDSTGE